jgi:ABC-type transport system involved in cytochrome c biogenesis permease subunit
MTPVKTAIGTQPQNAPSTLRFLSWGVVAAAALYLGYNMAPARSTTPFDLEEFGTLPITHGGRIQPLDSLARNSLLIISGRQSFKEEQADGTKITAPAIKWLLDVWTVLLHGNRDLDLTQENIGPAGAHKVFRIENLDVINLMGLEPRNENGYRYSLNELRPGIRALEYRYREAKGKEKRDLVDDKIIELKGHLNLFQELASHQSVLSVPPDSAGGSWAALTDFNARGSEAANDYINLLNDYVKNNAKDFDKTVNDYHAWLNKALPAESSKAKFEAFFNRLAPFYSAIVLYVFVFLLACLSWLYWPKELVQAALALGIFTFVVHSWALIARMYLMDRWFVFVTNLYASGIFIGWGCALVGLFLEFVYRNGIGAAAAGVTGALSLIIAHFLSLSGDTLNMVVAVLDTNFWLATHVTCITFGYSATFFAGFLGIGYIAASLAVPGIKRETLAEITRMIYGVICFATLLSFTGTVLGGIWADQSWGRFWGWDPKENGALLIVLMNALILHARWGGMVKARGLAVLSVLGNIVVSWSWFGVNMLGVGLHSYGFMEGAAYWLIAFVISQLIIAGLGMVDPAVVRKFFANALALNTPTKPAD